MVSESNTEKSKKNIETPVFSTLVYSIASSALIAMGLVPKMKEKKNRAVAQFNIDLLILLREKTKGNLTTDEQTLLNDSIKDLQVHFVQMKDTPTKETPTKESP